MVSNTDAEAVAEAVVDNTPRDQEQIAAFLAVVPSNVTEFAEKFLSWPSLLNTNSRQLRAYGLNVKQRKSLLEQVEIYKNRHRQQRMAAELARMRDAKLDSVSVQQRLFDIEYAHVYARQWRKAEEREAAHFWRQQILLARMRKKWHRNEWNGINPSNDVPSLKPMRNPEAAKELLKGEIAKLEELVQSGEDDRVDALNLIEDDYLNELHLAPVIDTMYEQRRSEIVGTPELADEYEASILEATTTAIFGPDSDSETASKEDTEAAAPSDTMKLNAENHAVDEAVTTAENLSLIEQLDAIGFPIEADERLSELQANANEDTGVEDENDSEMEAEGSEDGEGTEEVEEEDEDKVVEVFGDYMGDFHRQLHPVVEYDIREQIRENILHYDANDDYFREENGLLERLKELEESKEANVDDLLPDEEIVDYLERQGIGRDVLPQIERAAQRALTMEGLRPRDLSARVTDDDFDLPNERTIRPMRFGEEDHLMDGLEDWKQEAGVMWPMEPEEEVRESILHEAMEQTEHDKVIGRVNPNLAVKRALEDEQQRHNGGEVPQVVRDQLKPTDHLQRVNQRRLNKLFRLKSDPQNKQ